MAFFDDMSAALADYPVTDVELEIVEVAIPGAVLNEGEQGTFRVRITNRGPLNLSGVTVHVYGLNGATVANNSVIAPFVSDFTTQELAPVNSARRITAYRWRSAKVQGARRYPIVEDAGQGNTGVVECRPGLHIERPQRPARRAQGHLRRRGRGIVDGPPRTHHTGTKDTKN